MKAFDVRAEPADPFYGMLIYKLSEGHGGHGIDAMVGRGTELLNLINEAHPAGMRSSEEDQGMHTRVSDYLALKLKERAIFEALEPAQIAGDEQEDEDGDVGIG